jgi:hypothetical protein
MDELKLTNKLLLSISFSIFGMLLIFGLGFVFPAINPYVVIKWIIIVCAAIFVFPLVTILWSLKNFVNLKKLMKMFKKK